MNYNNLMHEVNSATLFDLWRFRTAIDKMMDDPERQKEIKRSLRQGMDIRYFDPVENRLIDASIIEVNRKKVLVNNHHDGKKWHIPFYMINLEGVDTNIRAEQTGKLDRNSLSVGSQVGWHSKHGFDRYGKIIKLNPKKAKIQTSQDGIWTVPYAMLFSVMEGVSQSTNEMLVIEAQVIDKD
jgi:hypothetical protein